MNGITSQTRKQGQTSSSILASGFLQRKCSVGECAEWRPKKTILQRKAVNQNEPVGNQSEPIGISSIVHEALNSPWQPLDAETRALMESRFGHDFSRVQVHADGRAAHSARMLGAFAYTVGNELVFGQDQYKPKSSAGRILIAHELVHTVQQENRRHSSATEEILEREAHNAVSAAILNRPVAISSTAAPPFQFLKVTSGALGKALETFTDPLKVPDRAIKLLRKSPSFMKLAAVLDSHYVWRGDSSKKYPLGSDSPNERWEKGPFKGKRELADVMRGNPSFKPFEAPPEPGASPLSGDVIQIESVDVPGFISEIAHEVTHAARFVGASTPPPATIAAEVNAGIKDEVEARKSEAKILGEIPAKDVKARVAQVGTRVPSEVERDISPASGMTYLENFFFARRLHEAQMKDGITDEDAEKIRAGIEKDFQAKTLPVQKLQFKPQLGPIGPELSDYGDTWFNRRLAQAEWKEFEKNNKPTDPDFVNKKEKLLQDHAKRFFEGRVLYQPLA